jgi:hypothetical protein
MTDQRHQELVPATRRRLIIGALLRGLVVTTVQVVLYFPLDQPWDTGTGARLRRHAGAEGGAPRAATKIRNRRRRRSGHQVKACPSSPRSWRRASVRSM